MLSPVPQSVASKTAPGPVGSPASHLSGEQILANARAMTSWLRTRNDDIETARRLPADIVSRLRQDGIFRMNMPRLWGGPEMTSMQQIEVIEELSRGDASVGWCAMIGCDSGLYSGYLDDATARELYPRLDMVQAGWIYPVGFASRVEGGYEVSGSWMFGSGITHCDVLAAGCLVVEHGRACIGPNGKPEWRVMLARPSEFEIVDTWETTGLKGTGSLDYRCKRVFVPVERSFSFHEPAKREGVLWRWPDAFLRKMAGIPLGAAREAIDIASEILTSKMEFPSGQPLREIARVQLALAEAEALLGAARSYVFSTLERQWELLEQGKELGKNERAHVWLARTNAFQAARDVVRIMYDAIGGSAIYSRRSGLDRLLRDTQTMCQHICGQAKAWEGVGGMLLGAENAPTHPLL